MTENARQHRNRTWAPEEDAELRQYASRRDAIRAFAGRRSPAAVENRRRVLGLRPQRSAELSRARPPRTPAELAFAQWMAHLRAIRAEFPQARIDIQPLLTALRGSRNPAHKRCPRKEWVRRETSHEA